MDMIRHFLVALHPRGWRERYGEEFAALLEDTRLTPVAAADVAAHCVGLRVRAHLDAVLVAVAMLASVACDITAYDARLTANILWAPTSPLRALALLGTIGPWAAVIVRIRARRRSATRA